MQRWDGVISPRMRADGSGSDVKHDDATVRFLDELEYVARSLIRLGVARCDVEDLTQEVFEVFHRRRSKFDPERPLRPWLFGIAYKVASRHRLRRARELPVGVVEVSADATSAEEITIERQRRALVERALSTLSLKLRSVFVMHEIDDVDVRDAAQALGIPLFTAYSRLRKARRDFIAAYDELMADKRSSR